jgi:hypothetical protein
MPETARNLLKHLMKEASIEDWCNYIEMDNKNFWTLQNNWMYNVEQKYSQEAALQFDGLCYGRAIEVAAYRLKKMFTFGNDDLDTLAKIYQLTPAGSYIDIEFIRESENVLLRRVRDCPMQAVRLGKGMEPIECKPALTIAAANIAKVVNPEIKITKVLCPPDPHPDDLWCDVVYELKR